MVFPQLILASNSPRRRELLALLGKPFTVLPADINEDVLPGEAPDEYVRRLAGSKARAVAAQWSAGHPQAGSGAPPETCIIAADTTVAAGRQILGKPSNPAEARQMLAQLRGRTHQVYTALAVLEVSSGRLEVGGCLTAVQMRLYSPAEVEDYIASGDPFDKAGAYAIQNDRFHPVERFTGCYANVVGFPICLLSSLLARFDVCLSLGVPAACPTGQEYQCEVCEKLRNSLAA